MYADKVDTLVITVYVVCVYWGCVYFFVGANHLNSLHHNDAKVIHKMTNMWQFIFLESPVKHQWELMIHFNIFLFVFFSLTDINEILWENMSMHMKLYISKGAIYIYCRWFSHEITP